jgi:hypothetical protein
MNRTIGTFRLFHAAPVDGRQARSPAAVDEREAAHPYRARSPGTPAVSPVGAGPARARALGRAGCVRLRGGQKGTRQLLTLYGDGPVCVRHRYDPQRRSSLNTTEILAAERDWDPSPARFAPAEMWGCASLSTW